MASYRIKGDWAPSTTASVRGPVRSPANPARRKKRQAQRERDLIAKTPAVPVVREGFRWCPGCEREREKWLFHHNRPQAGLGGILDTPDEDLAVLCRACRLGQFQKQGVSAHPGVEWSSIQHRGQQIRNT